MLKLYSLISLLVICVRAVITNSNGAYNYNNASEELNRRLMVPNYLVGSGNILGVEGSNGPFKNLSNSSAVHMDSPDGAPDENRHYNTNSNISFSGPCMEENKTSTVGLVKSSINTLIQDVVTFFSPMSVRHSCGRIYHTIGDVHYTIETCSAGKGCDYTRSFEITNAAEYLFLRYVLHPSSINGFSIHDHDPTWRTCVTYYRDSYKGIYFLACPPRWC